MARMWLRVEVEVEVEVTEDLDLERATRNLHPVSNVCNRWSPEAHKMFHAIEQVLQGAAYVPRDTTVSLSVGNVSTDEEEGFRLLEDDDGTSPT